jgi:hypothetical protein
MTDVVDRVVAAINARDVDAFVSCYAQDATHLVRDGVIARERLVA